MTTTWIGEQNPAASAGRLNPVFFIRPTLTGRTNKSSLFSLFCNGQICTQSNVMYNSHQRRIHHPGKPRQQREPAKITNTDTRVRYVGPWFGTTLWICQKRQSSAQPEKRSGTERLQRSDAWWACASTSRGTPPASPCSTG